MKNIKLTKLERKEMKSIIGGEIIKCVCGCGCKYENTGGSSTADNKIANIKNNIKPEGTQLSLYFWNTNDGTIKSLLGTCINC